MTKPRLTMEMIGKFSSRTPPNLSLREALEWHRRNDPEFSISPFLTRDGHVYFPGEVGRLIGADA
jgi:hypothetical protein